MKTVITAFIFVLAACSPAPVDSAPELSPLAAYPGFGHDPQRDKRAFAVDEAKRQQIISACMKNAGFSYTPEISIVITADDTNRSERRQSRASQPAPNKPYYQTLDTEKQLAYNLALYGVPDPNSETDLWNPSSPTGGGCWGEAIRGHVGIYDAAQSVNNEYLDMKLGLRKDARVMAQERKWSTCMQNAGFKFDTISELKGAQSNMGERPGKSAMPMDSVADAVTQSELCLDNTNYDKVMRAVTLEAETEFVARHKVKLDKNKYRE